MIRKLFNDYWKKRAEQEKKEPAPFLKKIIREAQIFSEKTGAMFFGLIQGPEENGSAIKLEIGADFHKEAKINIRAFPEVKQAIVETDFFCPDGIVHYMCTKDTLGYFKKNGKIGYRINSFSREKFANTIIEFWKLMMKQHVLEKRKVSKHKELAALQKEMARVEKALDCYNGIAIYENCAADIKSLEARKEEIMKKIEHLKND
ncbi:MAG: hypothetical protein GF370_03785 [Candidatus Nealsonbacteria bacterium]|nr:hypothetical protein [Candidatus Nealsonbacteria bacterium]